MTYVAAYQSYTRILGLYKDPWLYEEQEKFDCSYETMFELEEAKHCVLTRPTAVLQDVKSTNTL